MPCLERAAIKAACVAALSLFFGSCSARAADCSLKLVASYDMEPRAASLIVVPMVIAGKPRDTTLDTGSFASWVTQSFVDEAKLETHAIRSDFKVYGTKDRVTRYAVVPSVEIGAVRQPESRFVVLPNTDDTKIAASLGNNALEQYDVELDFAAHKVKFFSQDHCEGQVVYWAKTFAVVPFKMVDDRIQIEMTLDGHDLDTVFDTATTYTTINKRVLLGLFGRAESSEKEVTLPGGYKASAAAFDSLTIGGVTFPKPSLIVLDDTMRDLARDDVPVKDQNQAGVILPHLPHLILGLDAMRQLHLYIAYKERKIYVTAADAH